MAERWQDRLPQIGRRLVVPAGPANGSSGRIVGSAPTSPEIGKARTRFPKWGIPEESLMPTTFLESLEQLPMSGRGEGSSRFAGYYKDDSKGDRHLLDNRDVGRKTGASPDACNRMAQHDDW